MRGRTVRVRGVTGESLFDFVSAYFY
jgi:hypothetical protein